MKHHAMQHKNTLTLLYRPINISTSTQVQITNILY